MNEAELVPLLEALAVPFYKQMSFWIGTILGVGGLTFSIMSFVEAKSAKIAANEAGKTVKIQTITIELTEINQRLDSLDVNIQFSEARDLLNELSRRLRRLIAPFEDHGDLSEACSSVESALSQAKQALEEIRPTADVDIIEKNNAVYLAMEGHFANISSCVARLMGLFEKRTIEVTSND